MRCFLSICSQRFIECTWIGPLSESVNHILLEHATALNRLGFSVETHVPLHVGRTRPAITEQPVAAPRVPHGSIAETTRVPEAPMVTCFDLVMHDVILLGRSNSTR